MIGLLQRVASARVLVDGRVTGEIGRGLLVLLCAERGDSPREADALLAKLLAYRVFPDEAGRMNRSLRDLAADDGDRGDGAREAADARETAGLLLVPQFTLAADTQSGTRPSFTPAAAPELGRRLFDHVVARARDAHPAVETGIFGAEMKVHLVNDGPVTFWLQVRPPKKEAP